MASTVQRRSHPEYHVYPSHPRRKTIRIPSLPANISIYQRPRFQRIPTPSSKQRSQVHLRRDEDRFHPSIQTLPVPPRHNPSPTGSILQSSLNLVLSSHTRPQRLRRMARLNLQTTSQTSQEIQVAHSQLPRRQASVTI